MNGFICKNRDYIWHIKIYVPAAPDRIQISISSYILTPFWGIIKIAKVSDIRYDSQIIYFFDLNIFALQGRYHASIHFQGLVPKSTLDWLNARYKVTQKIINFL